MCVCLICGAGSGVIACIFSLIFSIVATSHLIGFTSPRWYKNDGDSGYQGLYYTCDGTDCEQVNEFSETLSEFTLAVIVLVSSIALLLIFLIITCCTHYRYVSLGTCMTYFFGGWFVIQEIITLIILIIIATDYDTLGWSAYAFCLPGVAALPIVILILLYKKCSPTSSIGII